MQRQRGTARHARRNGTPSDGHLAHDLRSEATTPRFGFITPNLCNDGHDSTCAGPNSTGGNTGGLTGADQFLQAWVPLIMSSPAYKHGDLLVVITFDESELGGATANQACCNEESGPNTQAPGDAPTPRTARRPAAARSAPCSSTRSTSPPARPTPPASYDHYSALRSYEDLLGLTTGGADGEGHLGFAAAKGLAPFGPDVFPAHLSGAKK